MPGGYYADVETAPALQQALERLGKLEALLQERRFDSTIVPAAQAGITYAAGPTAAYNANNANVSQVHFIRRGGLIQVDLQLYPSNTAHSTSILSGIPQEFRPMKDLRFITEASATPAAGAAGWEHSVQMRTDGGINYLTYGTTPAAITGNTAYVSASFTYLARM